MKQVRLTRAVPETAVVEDERGDTRGREAVGERPQSVASRSGQTVSHDDNRPQARIVRGRVQPSGAGVTARGET
jgi:hypothetical protein